MSQPKDSQHSQRLNILSTPREQTTLHKFKSARCGRETSNKPCYAVVAYDIALGYTRTIARFYYERLDAYNDESIEATARNMAQDLTDSINLQD